MASKKIIYIIVEGPSDETALGVILSRIYSSNEVYVEVTHGDITSDEDIAPNNIEERINDSITGYAKHTFLKEDFQRVIHLVDMDGAYVPPECVVFDEGNTKTFYKQSEIHTNDRRKIIIRNGHKSANLNYLRGIDNVWGGVPYRCYYMSCNLDHVLYDKPNSTDREKIENAVKFAKMYRDDLDGFLSFICDSPFSRDGDFEKSWDYIRQGTHSLERNTNFGICLADIRETRQQRHDEG